MIAYSAMCSAEGASLQRGMNFRMRSGHSVILMSRRRNAPYRDAVRDEGRTIIYEGHDAPRTADSPSPKAVDQPTVGPYGRPTQNGLFLQAALAFKSADATPESVRAYEKLHQGIWVYNGSFRLTDAWTEPSEGRSVCKFRLDIVEDDERRDARSDSALRTLEPTRVIPSDVKLEVWKRDAGRCVRCGSRDNLHFDHVLPYSLGGTSLMAQNVQILCARHNLEKHDRIE